MSCHEQDPPQLMMKNNSRLEKWQCKDLWGKLPDIPELL